MLSTKRISSGDYPEESVKRTEEYVSTGKEPPGVWFGNAATALGLKGTVKAGELKSLLQGKHPKKNEETIFEMKDDSVVGFDMTFSCSKTVSILAAVADDKTSAKIRKAFADSVNDAMSHFQDEMRVRDGRAGWQQGQGIIGVKYEHFDSREGDPQLHEHFYLAARALNADGEFGAMNTRDPYEMQKLLGAHFRASMASKMRDMGFGIVEGVSGTFEIEGVDEGLVSLFSQRSKQIADAIDKRVNNYAKRQIAEVKKMGLTDEEAAEAVKDKVENYKNKLLEDPKARQIAAYATRKGKDIDKSREQQIAEWKNTAKREFGFDAKRVKELKKAKPQEIESIDFEAVVDRALAGRSVFKMRELETELWVEKQFHPELDVNKTLREMMDRTNDRLGFLVDSSGEHWLTKASLRDKEEKLQAWSVAASEGGTSHGVDKKTVAGVLDAEERRMRTEFGSKFNAEAWADQRAAIERLIDAPSLAMTLGRAGAGKTTTFATARKVYEAGGYRLLGACIGEVAATNLETEAGIRSRNIAQWKAKWAKGDFSDLDDKTVFVIDEAAMVGSEDLHEIISTVRGRGGKVVLLGDHQQIQNIASGQAFEMMSRHLGKAMSSLEFVTRQKDADFREALSLLRDDGDAEPLIDFLESKDAIVAKESRDDAMDAIAMAWLEDPASLAEKLMMAGKVEDVEALNAKVHDRLREQGKIGEEHFVMTKIGDAEPSLTMLSVGDRIAFRKNDRKLGVRNGDLAEVLDIAMKKDGSHVVKARFTDAKGKERTVEFDTGDYRSFRLGYCVTSHAAQGKTVSSAYCLIDRTMSNRQSVYVQASRAKGSARLFMTEDERKDIVRLMSRSSLKQTTLEYGILDQGVDYDDTKAHYGACKSIREAVSRKDEGEIRRLVAEGSDIESREGKAQNTALHLAVRDGNQDAIRTLLELGASPSPQNYRGITPLHDAIKRGDMEIVGMLVSAGADPMARAWNGETPFGLLRTTITEREKAAEPVDAFRNALLTMSAATVPNLPEPVVSAVDTQPTVLPQENPNTATPPPESRSDDNVHEQPDSVVQTAPVSATTETETRREPSPESQSDDNVHEQPVKTAVPDATTGTKASPAEPTLPEAATIAATTSNEPDSKTLSAKLSHIIESNMPDTQKKESTVGDACRDIIIYMEKGEDVGKRVERLMFKSKNGERRKGAAETLLHIAAGTGSVKALKLALAHGADINSRDPKTRDCTALHIACSKGNEDAAKFLIANGADINLTNADGATAMLFAEAKGIERIFPRPVIVQIPTPTGTKTKTISKTREDREIEM